MQDNILYLTFINKMRLGERIDKVVEHSGLTIPKYAQAIGVKTPQAIRDLISGKTKTLSEDMQTKILSYSPEINAAWLFTGEGDMLRDDPDMTLVEDASRERLIPFYDVETTGGYEGKVSSSDEGELVGYIQPGGWFDEKETAAIRHVGDSMVEYPNGCILAVRRVQDRRLLVYGRNYVIETREYRITKRVQRGDDDDSLMLYSTNSEKYEDGRLVHEPFSVAFEDIINIYSVLGYIVNQMGEIRLIKP